MKTKARLVAESVRLKQWSQQIRDCQNRPVGLTMDDWCRQQGITKANYYSRLRRVRQAILNYSSEENGDCNLIPDFVELPVPADCLSTAIPREQTMTEKSARTSPSYNSSQTGTAYRNISISIQMHCADK